MSAAFSSEDRRRRDYGQRVTKLWLNLNIILTPLGILVYYPWKNVLSCDLHFVFVFLFRVVFFFFFFFILKRNRSGFLANMMFNFLVCQSGFMLPQKMAVFDVKTKEKKKNKPMMTLNFCCFKMQCFFNKSI